MADDVSTMKVTDSGDAMAPEEPSKAQQLAQLTQLSAQAEQKYLLKDYSAAADLYAQATELQAKLNGEMAPQNAELLFLYGRSLYKVGVSNSEVLGGGVGGAAGSSADAADEKGSGVAAERSGRKHNQAVPLSAAAAAAAAAKGRANEDEATERAAPSTLFQFSGDENFDVAEDDEDGGDDDADNDAEHEGDEGEEAGAENGPANAEDESEDDDFGTAWVSLDLARVLFARQLEELERASATTVPTETPPADAQRIDKGKERADPEPAHVVRVKTRLADTHGLLGDISLEHEEYGAAVDDFRAALALKRALYAPASSVVAEAHYKLSLALEFVSIENRAGAADGGEELRYDAAMRAEAAAQMEAAIGSARARLAKEEEELLRGSQAAAGSSVTKESLQELREVIEDMEQRLADLRKAPMSVERATEEAALRDGTHPLAGILGSLLDSSPGERRAKLEEVMQGANDVSGLVRRNKPAQAAAAHPVGSKADTARSDEETGKGNLAVTTTTSAATAAEQSMPGQTSSNGHVDADNSATNGAKRKAEDPEAALSSSSTTGAAHTIGQSGSNMPPSPKRTKT